MNDTINLNDAKTHLSRLVEQAARGNAVVIAKAGKPMARLVPYHAVDGRRALGTLAGTIPDGDGIKSAFADDIAAMFPR